MAELTSDQKREIKEKFIEDFREYGRIDYDDDAETLEIIVDAAAEELADMIPEYDFYSMSQRQRLLTMMKTLSMYDERRTHSESAKVPLSNYASLMLKEMYGDHENG